MRRAGGGEARKYKRISIDRPVDVTLEQRFGLRAVEKDVCDVRVAPEERVKVVRGFQFDARVQAAWPDARMQNVPERDVGGAQGANPGLIGRGRINCKKVADDPPEGVLLVRVILARRQRRASRHASEDEDSRVARGDRMETANAGLAQGGQPFFRTWLSISPFARRVTILSPVVTDAASRTIPFLASSVTL